MFKRIKDGKSQKENCGNMNVQGNRLMKYYALWGLIKRKKVGRKNIIYLTSKGKTVQKLLSKISFNTKGI